MPDMVGTCDTCERPDQELFVYALAGVPMSCANCKVCLDMNAYPWGVVVGNTCAIGGLEHAADWWKDAVIRSLAVVDKTIFDFEREVAEELEREANDPALKDPDA